MTSAVLHDLALFAWRVSFILIAPDVFPCSTATILSFLAAPLTVLLQSLQMCIACCPQPSEYSIQLCCKNYSLQKTRTNGIGLIVDFPVRQLHARRFSPVVTPSSLPSMRSCAPPHTELAPYCTYRKLNPWKKTY